MYILRKINCKMHMILGSFNISIIFLQLITVKILLIIKILLKYFRMQYVKYNILFA